jgi:oligopeptide/dipeptide ABC transporter ATP-binding protein
MSATSLLDVRELVTGLDRAGGMVKVVNGVSFSVEAGETVAIVGESGCGKSITALSLMRLLPKPQAHILGGQVWLDGRDLLAMSEAEVRPLRGSKISMIFQDPISSLNPVVSIGAQLVEGIRRHTTLSRRAAHERAIELLRHVNIPDAANRFNDYPHRLSGGMCQRIGIAMAIACGPRLLIADEPTTALDVTIQAQVLELLKQLQAETSMAMLFITHDFGVVADMADRVVVMYAGRKVEEASAEDIFDLPLHPYTQGLLAATLHPGKPVGGRLAEIPGTVPSLDDHADGCPFAPRCPRAIGRCFAEEPQIFEPYAGRQVACWVVEAESESDVATFNL